MTLTEAIPKCDCGLSMYQFSEDLYKCRHCDQHCPYQEKNEDKCERCKNYRVSTRTKMQEWYPTQNIK